jgi:hypothetical protein
MIFIDEGIQIDSSDAHPKNAREPRTEILQPDSNVTRKSSSQRWKQALAIVSIDERWQSSQSMNGYKSIQIHIRRMPIRQIWKSENRVRTSNPKVSGNRRNRRGEWSQSTKERIAIEGMNNPRNRGLQQLRSCNPIRMSNPKASSSPRNRIWK